MYKQNDVQIKKILMPILLYSVPFLYCVLKHYKQRKCFGSNILVYVYMYICIHTYTNTRNIKDLSRLLFFPIVFKWISQNIAKSEITRQTNECIKETCYDQICGKLFLFAVINVVFVWPQSSQICDNEYLPRLQRMF